MHAYGANGVKANINYSGGGGGGRIAVFWTNASFSGTFLARGGAGGTNGSNGGAGTVWLKAGTNAPDLFIDNGIDSGMLGSAGTWVTTNADLVGLRSLTIRRYGILKQAAGDSNGLSITIPTLTIETNAAINVSGRGYPGVQAGAGTGFGGGGAGSGDTGGGGGGYGGRGGAGGFGAGGGTYGSMTNPTNLGSAAGGGWTATGGAGGGAVRLVVEALTVNGEIAADGFTAAPAGSLYGSGGGGSGGSIWINANSLAGSGRIHADGKDGWYSRTGEYSGGGGGGRISVTIIQAPFYRIRYTAAGGTSGFGGNPGLAGTVYQNFKTRGTVVSAW
jgi:hypothetical protein